jgi:hypothetical protein
MEERMANAHRFIKKILSISFLLVMYHAYPQDTEPVYAGHRTYIPHGGASFLYSHSLNKEKSARSLLTAVYQGTPKALRFLKKSLRNETPHTILRYLDQKWEVAEYNNAGGIRFVHQVPEDRNATIAKFPKSTQKVCQKLLQKNYKNLL